MHNLGTRIFFAQYPLIIVQKIPNVYKTTFGAALWSVRAFRSTSSVRSVFRTVAPNDPSPRTLFPFDAAPDAQQTNRSRADPTRRRLCPAALAATRSSRTNAALSSDLG